MESSRRSPPRSGAIRAQPLSPGERAWQGHVGVALSPSRRPLRSDPPRLMATKTWPCHPDVARGPGGVHREVSKWVLAAGRCLFLSSANGEPDLERFTLGLRIR